MRQMNEFELINICNKLHEFGLITEKRIQIMINKNRKRGVNEAEKHD